MNNDAAARFYRASHERHLARLSDLTGSPIDDRAPAVIQDPSHRYHAIWREAAERPPGTALELGYGGIATVRAVAPLISGEYHVTDIVDRFSGVALPSNTHAHVCNLDDDFPFDKASFELVIAMMVVEHLYDPFHALSEISRVLKNGGRLVMNLPNIAGLKCRIELLQGRMPVTSSADWFDKREWDGNHLHYFTVADVRRLCALYGLKLISMYPVGKWTWIKRAHPALLCQEITYVLEKHGARPL